MKNLKIKLSALAVLAIVVIGVTFTSCQKEKNNKIQTQELIEVSEKAASDHNGFLKYQFKLIRDKKLPLFFEKNHFSKLLPFYSDYFMKLNYNKHYIEEATKIYNPFILSNETEILAFLKSKNNNENIFNKYLQEIRTQLTSHSNQNNFNVFCQQMIVNVSISKLDNNNKYILANIIGVAKGSFFYWTNNYNEWDLLYNQGLSHKQTKKQKIADLVDSDLTGAGAGAVFGGFLAGVGAGPGAVLGGAIASGIRAWSWD